LHDAVGIGSARSILLIVPAIFCSTTWVIVAVETCAVSSAASRL